MDNQKKLLILGGTIATYDVVQRAKALGLYTIVTDNLDGGVTKEIADEVAHVSTADMDGLEALIREKQIDGVFTGASEFNIRNMLHICPRMGLPVYTDLTHWDVCSNKRRFKALCRAHGVPVVREYEAGVDYTPDDVSRLRFPVIVKPVDSYSGNGISVCEAPESFREAYDKALECSPSGNIIVEDYMTGDNVEVYYIARNGEIMLMTISDRITVHSQEGSPLPVRFHHPSKYLDEYLEKENDRVIRMFRDFGIKNGVFFMESFYQDGKFRFYEMGYRLNATMEYAFVDHFNGFNPLDLMILYAVSGQMGAEDISEKNDPHFNGAACELAPLLKCGTIREVRGVEQILAKPSVIHYTQFHQPGTVIDSVGTLNQSFARIHVAAGDRRLLEEEIRSVYAELHVLDADGNEMLWGI